MATNYRKSGRYVTVTAGAAITSGAGVLLGTLFGVAQTTVANGEEVEISTTGEFDLNKTSAQAWTAGDAIFWDPTPGEATTATTAGNVFIGVATLDAANPSTIGRVRLNGSAPAAAQS